MANIRQVEEPEIFGGAEARVLLQLLRLDGDSITNAEMMRLTGISNPNTYFAAKRSLAARGYLRKPYSYLRKPYSPPTESVVPPTETVATESVAPTETVATETVVPRPLRPLRLRAALAAEVVAEAGADADADADAERGWRALLAEADRLPGGDAADPAHDTAFRTRRQAQVTRLAAAWRGVFGQDLIERAAKDLLQASGGYAEDVLDQMEYVTGREAAGKPVAAKLGYILAALRRIRAESHAESRSAPAASSLSSRNHTSEAGEHEADTFWLAAPTPATQRILDKMRQRGLLTADRDTDTDPDRDPDRDTDEANGRGQRRTP